MIERFENLEIWKFGNLVPIAIGMEIWEFICNAKKKLLPSLITTIYLIVGSSFLSYKFFQKSSMKSAYFVGSP